MNNLEEFRVDRGDYRRSGISHQKLTVSGNSRTHRLSRRFSWSISKCISKCISKSASKRVPLKVSLRVSSQNIISGKE